MIVKDNKSFGSDIIGVYFYCVRLDGIICYNLMLNNFMLCLRKHLYNVCSQLLKKNCIRIARTSMASF